jgi:hypothetical protein
MDFFDLNFEEEQEEKINEGLFLERKFWCKTVIQPFMK